MMNCAISFYFYLHLMLHEYVQTFYFTARKNFRWKLNTPLKVSTLHCKVQAAGLWSAPSIIALC
jgi:hypothetical protein